jgi:prevent-host-death family protein
VKTINIYEAKARLSQLLTEVEGGASITIARAGKPVAVLTAVQQQATAEQVQRRFGFLRGRAHAPTDFDVMGAGTIEAMFAGSGGE